jgi:prepilin-type N-terminal cleavage/methylation domain-containing protein
MRKKTIGFSLIELLIVLAIAGALTALAVPTFNEYRRKSNDTTAHADIKNSMQIIRASLR